MTLEPGFATDVKSLLSVDIGHVFRTRLSKSTGKQLKAIILIVLCRKMSSYNCEDFSELKPLQIDQDTLTEQFYILSLQTVK